MNQEEAQRLNFESRKETLLAMMRRYIQELEKLDPYEAVKISTRVTDFLLTDIDLVQRRVNKDEVDKMINSAFKSES